MASRRAIQSRIRELVREIAAINQVELFMGDKTLPDELFLKRLQNEAAIAEYRLTLFSSRNIEGDEI